MDKREIVFREEDHTYWCDGRRVPGVTSILDPIGSLDGIPEYVLERKAAIGSDVHLATEFLDKDCLDWASVHPVLIPYIDAWILFKLETGFEPELIERKVFNRRLWYAGTLDRTGTLGDGRRVLIDIKTTVTMYPCVGPQLAAYEEAYVDEGGQRPDIRAAVQLRKDGSYRFHIYSDKSDKAVFVSLLTIHNFRVKHGIK